MSRKKEKICRLCLEVVDGDCELIEEITSEIFEVLLLQVDLSISEEPVICGNCKDTMQKAFEFKSACISIEEFVVSTSRSADSVKLDIRDICLDGDKSIGMTINEDCGVCRFCLQCSESGNFVSLKSLKKTIDEDVLLKCVPELDQSIIKEPVVCILCKKSLENYFNFTSKCWSTESKIKQYSETGGRGNRGQITLVDLLTYTESVSISHLVKKEENEADNAEFIFPGGNQTLMKIEELDIKQEDLDTNTKMCRRNRATYSPADSLGTYLHKCSLCKFKTKYRRSLKNHMLIHKDISEVTTFKCENCSYTSKKKGDMKRHLLTHKDRSEVAMYTCDPCKFETKYRVNLDRHMKRHTETAKYKCEVCNLKTKYKAHLKQHMAVHKYWSQAVVYKCDDCTFATKSLDDHKGYTKTHQNYSKVIAYKCNLCELETEHQVVLKCHIKTHKRTSKQIKEEPEELPSGQA